MNATTATASGTRSGTGKTASSGLLAPATGPASRAFPWLVTAASTWILLGLFVDGWFHIHDPGLETFFTPWHALLYSGVAAAVVVHLVERWRRRGLPRGYLLSVAGGLVVSAAGFVDMVWHTVLGVEEDLAALLSPPHLLLITAGTLVFAGPLRAALASTSAPRLPAAFAAAYVVTGLAFFTQYANPLTHLYPVAGYTPVDGGGTGLTGSPELVEMRAVAGVAGVVVFAVLLAGAVAVVRGLRPLPPGALFVVVAVPSAAMTTLRDTLFLLPAVLVAALLVEVVGRWLSPALLAAAAPALVVLGWALSLAATRELAWGLELLSGAVCSAAAAGYLVGWVHAQGARSRV